MQYKGLKGAEAERFALNDVVKFVLQQTGQSLADYHKELPTYGGLAFRPDSPQQRPVDVDHRAQKQFSPNTLTNGWRSSPWHPRPKTNTKPRSATSRLRKLPRPRFVKSAWGSSAKIAVERDTAIAERDAVIVERDELRVVNEVAVLIIHNTCVRDIVNGASSGVSFAGLSGPEIVSKCRMPAATTTPARGTDLPN